ncbi:hypothetical protein SORBI_3010G256100 [Sorghum bicolor]|nr:hypothetical protein SORBI_3010G256100 [Sorghum bicolor]
MNSCFLDRLDPIILGEQRACLSLSLSISTDLARTSLLHTRTVTWHTAVHPHISSLRPLHPKQPSGEQQGRPAMGKQATATALALLCVVLLAATAVDDAAAAASCNPSALSACSGALFGGAVTQGCCASLRAQQPCLCQYKRDPAYRGYVNGPVAQSVTRACGLPMMKC